jgi:hypothetical protein
MSLLTDRIRAAILANPTEPPKKLAKRLKLGRRATEAVRKEMLAAGEVRPCPKGRGAKDSERRIASELRANGRSFASIGAALGRHPKTVQSWFTRNREKMSAPASRPAPVERHHGGGAVAPRPAPAPMPTRNLSPIMTEFEARAVASMRARLPHAATLDLLSQVRRSHARKAAQ